MVGMIGDEIATGPFAGGLIAGAQSAARERGHALVVMNTGKEGDVSADLGVLEDRDVDALIFATVMTRPVRVDRKLQTSAVILLNCYDDRRRLPSVLPDDRKGGASATRLAVQEAIAGSPGSGARRARARPPSDWRAMWRPWRRWG